MAVLLGSLVDMFGSWPSCLDQLWVLHLPLYLVGNTKQSLALTDLESLGGVELKGPH